MSIAGSSSTALAAFDPSVTVDDTTTLATGGSPNDWHGRAYVCELTNGNLLQVYRSGEKHQSAAAELHCKFSDDRGATWTAADTKLGGGAVTGFPLTPSAGFISAGEGMPLVPRNGVPIILLWRVDGSGDWPEDPKGTEQATATDETAESWGAPVAVAIAGVSDLEHTFLTDDWVLHPNTGVLYTCGRVYNADTPTDSYTILVKNETAGADPSAWEKVSNITAPGSDTQEVGIEYLGDGFWVALVGSLNNDETIMGISTDDGLTWSTSDVTGTAASITRRHKLYTRAHLQGLPGWQYDNVLIASCFENQTPGDSQGRRNAILIGLVNRSAKSVTWDSLHYLAAEFEDGGYGDVWWKSADDYSSLGGEGTLLACAVKQYDFTLALT